ncbi:MAG TPA: pyridoxal-phosphate dependent enzyme, partial [Candidatus Paceibacterota bacterium]|nr:pyridoxal-phosphate dependent enzyme [Candidatus Paceibacterota bacterium]
VKNIKVWPAGGIIARGIERGEYLSTDTIVESTSGNFGEGLAWVVERLLVLAPDFPIKRVLAVVPRSLQPGKIARLRANKRIELEFADNAVHAMKWAEDLARRHGYWYTQQYWNPDNPDSYMDIGTEIARQLPELGILVCGVGSGGTFSGTVLSLKEAFKNRARPHRLHCVAVAVEPYGSVGGVRTEIGLHLGGKPGLPWRMLADDVNYVGLHESLTFSAALWQHAPDDPGKKIIGGESTGFALAGGLLSVLSLKFRGKLDSVRNESGEVVLAFVAPDTYGPYREDYEAAGIVFPG